MMSFSTLCFLLAAASPNPADTTNNVSTAAPAIAPAATSIRSARPWNVGVEIGNSGLAGLGINAGYNFTPHWALDGGFGLSVFGFKAGLRGRYNFVDANLTPFVGLGAMAATNPWDDYREVVPMAQGVVGLSWLADNGFSLLASVGWMQRLDGVKGSWVTPITWTGSDVVCSLATGYGF